MKKHFRSTIYGKLTAVKSLFIVLLALVVSNQVNGQSTFYSKSTATTFTSATLTDWGQNTDGTGTAPVAADFTNGLSSFIVANAAAITTVSSSNVVNNLSITSGSLTVNAAFTVSGALTVNGGTLTTTDGSSRTITVNGNLVVSSGTLAPGVGTSTITMGSTGAANINFSGGSVTLGNLNIGSSAGSSKVVTLLSNISVPTSRTLTINGKLNADVYVVSGAGAFTINQGIFGIATTGSTSFTTAMAMSGAQTFTSGSTQVAAIEYNASGNQTLNMATHPAAAGIRTGGSGIKTLSANTPTLTSNPSSGTATTSIACLYVAAGTTFADGGFTLTFNGSWSHIWVDGTYSSSGSGTILYGTSPTSSRIVAVDGTAFGDITIPFSGVSSVINLRAINSSTTAAISCRNLNLGNSSSTGATLILSETGTTNLTITGNVTLSNTSSSTPTLFQGTSGATSTVTLQGDLISSSTATTQNFIGATGTNTLIFGGTNNQVVTVGTSISGTVLPSGATMRVNKSAGTLTFGNGLTRNIAVTGAVQITQGNITVSGTYTLVYNSSSTLTYNGSLAQTVGGEFPTGGGTNSVQTLIINNSAGVSQTSGSRRVRTAMTSTSGVFTVDGASTTLTLGDALNAASSGFTFTSSIASALARINSGTITKNYGTGSINFVYNSSTASQTTGDELATSTNAGTFTVNNTFTTPTVTLGSATGIGTSGQLILTAGILVTSNTNSMTISSTSTGAISGGSATSYIRGPLIRTIPNTASAATYTFPVGKGSFSMLEFVNLTTGGTGSATFTVEAFDANSGGSAGTNLSAINTNRYWTMTGTIGTVTITTNTIRLTESGVGSTNRVGQSNTLAGAYINRGGTISGSTVLSNTSIDYSALASGTNFVVGTAGVYSTATTAIGASQPSGFQKITDIANLLTSVSVGANLVFELQSDYDGTTGETFPITFNQWANSGGTYTVTIRPASGVSLRTVSGSNTTALIDLNGVQNLTIDGRDGGTGSNKRLAINNAASGPAIRFINNAGGTNGNSLRYCTLIGNAASLTSGVVFFSNTSTAPGNDNNIIDNCDIDGNATSYNGIYSNGSSTSGQENSNNTITNCNIFNHFNSGVVTVGILLSSSGNTDWIIGTTGNGNRIYQTTSRTYTTGAIHRGIQVLGGNNHSIVGNTIGYANSSGSGTYTLAGGIASRYLGIELAVGNTVATSVQGNTIANFNLTTTSGASGTGGIFSGIYVSGTGSVNIGNLAGNTIGAATGTGSIVTSTSSGANAVYGIRIESSGTVVVSNNNVGSFTNSTSGANNASTFHGISLNAAGTFTVSGNTVGSTSTASSIQVSNAATTAVVVTNGIHVVSASSVSISQNTVANINNSNTGSGGTLIGINAASATTSVTQNTVRDLTCATTSLGTAGSATFGGIFMSSSTGNVDFSRNSVYNLTASASGSTAVNVYGIYIVAQTSGTQTFARNTVHSFSTVSTGAVQVGVYNNGGIGTYQNNMVRLGIDGSAASITSSAAITGILKASVSNCNYYFNSVYIGGSSVVSGSVNTFAFRRTSTGTDDIRNNIFVNARSNTSGTGKHFAITYNAITTATSNYNIYRANGTGGVLASIDGGTTNLTTLQAYRASMTSQELNSGVGDPNFTAPTAATPNLKVSGATPAEGAGVAISGITDDNEGDTRSSNSPTDIGADAGSYTTLNSTSDIFTPNITYTTLSNTASVSNRTISVTITDVGTGVPTSSGQLPRIFFRRSAPSASSWASTVGTFNSGDGNNGSWTFTIDYSVLSITPVAGETYQYYVVAQDQATTPNIWFTNFEATLPTHTDASTQTGAPASPNSYNVLAGLPTTISVGTGQTYTTLTANAGTGLFNAINTGALSGNTTVSIVSDITESGAIQLTNAGMAGFTLTIQDDGTSRVLSGNTGASGTPLVGINGAIGVTVNGGASRNLTFRNVNGAAPSASVGPAIQVNGGSSNIVIKNCNLESNASTSTTGSVFLGSTGTNDNIVIANNNIRGASASTSNVPANGIYSNSANNTNITIGGTTTHSGGNNIINFTSTGINLANVGNSTVVGHATTSTNGNNIYNEAGRAALTGINIAQGSSHTIGYNNFYQTSGTNTGAIIGITVGGTSAGNGVTINNNSIGGAAADRSGSALTTSTVFTGITIASSTGTAASIQGNNIGNISLSAANNSLNSMILGTSGNINIGTSSANIIGENVANSITCLSSMWGIAYTGANTINIENNTIRNFRYNDADYEANIGILVSGGTLGSLSASAAIASIKNNTITSLTHASTNSLGTGVNYIPAGIFVNLSSTANNIEGNTINGVNHTGTMATTQHIHGIIVNAIGGGTIHRNRISNLTSTSTGTTSSAATIFGIRMEGASSGVSVYNNQISISQSTASTQPLIRGIHLTSTNALNIRYNSIYIGGTAAAANNTYGIYRATTGASNIQNNLVYNERSGSGTHYAIGFGSSGAFGTINNNAYATSTTTVADNATVNNTIAQWRTTTSGEANSNSYLTSTLGSIYTNTSTGDLSLVSGNIRGIVARQGSVLAGITSDYANTTRGDGTGSPTANPSIGSIEYSGVAGLWMGFSSNASATTANWSTGSVPTSGTDVIIPSFAINDLTLGAGLTTGTLSIGSGRTLSINGQTLTVNSTVSGSGRFIGSASSNLTLAHTSGTSTLNFDRTSDGTSNALNNVTLSGSGGTTTIGDVAGAGVAQLYVNGVLDIQSGAILDVSNAVTANHLVLVSDGSNQARVPNVAGTLTQGANTKIVVERFISLPTPNTRSWRFITAPLTGNGLSLNRTVQYQWQNHQTSPANTLGGTAFGTNIYGPSGNTGMDGTTAGNTMRGWNYSTKAYSSITNTTSEDLFGSSANAANKAYMMFIRGDKTRTPTNGLTSSTRLRAVGRLQTGDQTFSYLTANTTDFVAVANPYASPVDWESVRVDGLTNINSNVYYLWDPRISSFGGWVTVDASTPPYAATPSPLSFTATNSRYIQSGQAFFVKVASNGTSGITFKESHKTGTSNNPTVTGAGNGLMDRLGVDLLLVNTDNSISVRDGLLMKYKNNFTTAINEATGEDVLKMNQSDETISIMQGSTKLGIEGRGFIQNTDTIKLQMERMVTGTNYKLAFFPTNFDATVTDARLIDKFLNTETPISLTANTDIPFTITSTTGSNAADRFMIVFRGTGNLPNNKLSLVATKKDKDVQLTWNIANEAGVKEYELQRSVDGTNFQAINNQVAANKGEYNNLDTKANNGINYYRVKMTMSNDDTRYSNTITINLQHQTSNPITIYPNPVKGKTIGLQLAGLDKGEYALRLVNAAGQTVYTQNIQVQGNNMSMQVTTNQLLAKGNYSLQLISNKGETYNQQVLVVE